MYTHAKLQRYTSTRANLSTHIHYVRHSGYPCQIDCKSTSTACKSKHVDHRAIGAQLRLSMPNTQAIYAEYGTSTSTACDSKHVDHRAIGSSPRLSMANAQTIHAKYCTSTSTACESKHEDHRAIGASPRLSTPNVVQVQVQRASSRTRAR